MEDLGRTIGDDVDLDMLVRRMRQQLSFEDLISRFDIHDPTCLQLKEHYAHLLARCLASRRCMDVENMVQDTIDNLQRDLETNRCVGCNADLGESNPRQYCCKTYCPNMWNT